LFWQFIIIIEWTNGYKLATTFKKSMLQFVYNKSCFREFVIFLASNYSSCLVWLVCLVGCLCLQFCIFRVDILHVPATRMGRGFTNLIKFPPVWLQNLGA